MSSQAMRETSQPAKGESDELALLRAEVERLTRDLDAMRVRAEAAEAAADHDVLTPTLNRRGFVDVLNRAMAYCARHGVPASLIYLDLDGFKRINDDLGHAAGDAALIHVAETLKANLRESDALGRLGGDEFALLLMNAALDDGREKARALGEALASRGFEWNGRQVIVNGAFGVRALSGQSDAEIWLAEADAAMWVRKKPSR